jgi:hypothetical protein
MEQILKSAIENKQLVEFSYSGHARIAEPHVLGINAGALQLLGYPVSSRSGVGSI